jgi:hypothetical protein
MSFLDRFKPQPKWRHADPAVRATAVAEVPDDEEHRAVLLELASEDPDSRVRRAAASRLTFAEDLVRVARAAKDEDLRRSVVERLVALASAPSEDDGEAALALEGLDDQRHLSTVAKESPHDTVRTAALGRVHDVRALGSVARHAAAPQTALEAVARIADRQELINVALKTDHKEVGLTALERVAATVDGTGDWRQTLESIAARAKNKAVARQARVQIQAIEQAEAAERAALEEWRQRLSGLMARIETCATAPAGPGSAGELAAGQAAWQAATAEPPFPIDQDVLSKYGSLIETARSSIARFEEAEAARAAAEERRLAAVASATELCDRVDALRGEDAEGEIDRARAEWEGLEANPDEAEFAALRARFEAACDRARERHRNRQELERVYQRLDEISQEATRLAAEDSFQEQAWNKAVQEWDGLIQRADALDSTITERYSAATEAVKRREEERKAAAERSVRQQVQRVEQLIDRAGKRAGAEDLTLREGERLARELRSTIETLAGATPAIKDDRERHALLERVRHAQGELSPRLHDLREMDEWKRFANAAVQEELIARTEALRVKYGFDLQPSAPVAAPPPPAESLDAAAAGDAAVVEGEPAEPPADAAPAAGPKPEDLEKLARELHEIQERWKTVAEAPRAQAQALWHRYRQAADPMQARVREFFAVRNEQRRDNFERKISLIAQAEALADSTDWIKTADALKKLQVEWQQVGPVPRQESKATWKRFREACDRFFTRRNADLAVRKEAWTANLARKEAMCKRAEEIAASTEWEKGAAEIRRLQAEWKTVGPVRRNKSEAIWQRFRAASDLFFERFKRRDEIDLQSKQADREGLVAELESLAPAGVETADASPPVHGGSEGLLERVRSLRSRWNLTTPVVRHGADPLSARFMSALERVMATYPAAFAGTELDADANRQKMERLCVRVETLTAEQAAQPASGSQALADMLREALASNTIGGRAGEESKWRSMAEDVRQAQAAWSRLGPVPGEAGRALTERFHRACNRFNEQYRRKMPQQSQRGRAVGTR